MTIPEAIRKISKQDVFESIVGTVKSVDMTSKTCVVTPVDDLPDLLDVRLSAIESPDKGIICVPVVNSIVIVGQTKFEQPHILLFSEIDTYQLIANTSITFNDGSHGGLIKIEDLVTKINNVENLVNNILTTLKGTTIPLAPSGTYAFAPLYSSLNNLTNTQKTDLENTKIKHG
jgi:hypothetical protein